MENRKIALENMEMLPKDLRRKIALELTPEELIKLCKEKPGWEKEICESKEFWRLKLQRDFPVLFNYYEKSGLTLTQPKNTYLKTFANYYKTLEDFSKKFDIDEREAEDFYKSVRYALPIVNKEPPEIEIFMAKHGLNSRDHGLYIGRFLSTLFNIEGYNLIQK